MSSLSHPLKLPKSQSSLLELKPFSKIKLVAIDLDGTLLSHHEDKPTESVGELILSLKSTIRLVIATGRTLKGTNKILTNLDLTYKSSNILVLYNGSLVVDTAVKAIIYHKDISNITTNNIINLSREYEADSFIYTVDSSNIIAAEAYHSLEDSEQVYFDGLSPKTDTEFNGMSLDCWNDTITKSATALMILPKNKLNCEALLNGLEKMAEISVTSSGGDYIEIRPKGSSKANGIKKWVGKPFPQFEQDEILSIGDNDNDVELLEWSGIGVAVKNASDKALSVANYITSYQSTNGVIEVFNLLKQTERYKNII